MWYSLLTLTPVQPHKVVWKIDSSVIRKCSSLQICKKNQGILRNNSSLFRVLFCQVFMKCFQLKVMFCCPVLCVFLFVERHNNIFNIFIVPVNKSSMVWLWEQLLVYVWFNLFLVLTTFSFVLWCGNSNEKKFIFDPKLKLNHNPYITGNDNNSRILLVQIPLR